MNRVWQVVALVAVIFPFATMLYELLINDQLAALVTVVLVTVWAAVLWLAWRSGGTRSPASGTPASAQSLTRGSPPARQAAAAAPQPRGALPPTPGRKDQRRRG